MLNYTNSIKERGVTLNASQAAYPIDALGENLDSSIDTSRMDVVGLVGSIDPEGHPPEDNPLQFAVVKYNELSGESERFFIVTDYKDKDGEVKKKWTQLPKGVPLTIGRQTADTIDKYDFKDGRDLTGEEFSKGVSRSHMTIELTESGINIIDTSTNGTEVQGVKKTETVNKSSTDVANGVLRASKVEVNPVEDGNADSKDLIDRVPQTEEEAREANEKRNKQKLVEQNKSIQEEIARIEAEFDQFREGFSERETMGMWKYTAGIMNKRDAQERGDGQGSKVFEQQAGEGLHELGALNMSNPNREKMSRAADTYLTYMQQLKHLRSKLKN